MKYCGTASALVPLCVDEASSPRLREIYRADSVQLAAAVIAADREPAALEIVSLDVRLATAARREGFTVLSSDAG